MTIKKYDEQPYESNFQAEIVDIQPGKEGTLLALSETLFFPEEGGQSPDIGWINGKEVLDVQIRDEVIWHEVKADMTEFAIGDTVQGEIDFAYRYDLMQQHSGEHVLTGCIYRKYGYTNVGFHLSKNIVTLDVSGMLSAEQICQMEKEANEIIYQNVPITAEYPEPEVLKQLQYRSKKEISQEVRIVSIGDYDCCACCAPHVRSTGEIGSILITKWEKYKGGVRLEIKCGSRAIQEHQNNRDIMKQMMKQLSAKPENFVETIERMKQETTELNLQLSELKDNFIRLKSEKFSEQEMIITFEENMDTTTCRNYVNLLMEKAAALAAVFVATQEGYRYMIGSNVLDVKKIQDMLKERFMAKGGGKPPMIQGTLQGDPKEITQEIQNFIK